MRAPPQSFSTPLKGLLVAASDSLAVIKMRFFEGPVVGVTSRLTFAVVEKSLGAVNGVVIFLVPHAKCGRLTGGNDGDSVEAEPSEEAHVKLLDVVADLFLLYEAGVGVTTGASFLPCASFGEMGIKRRRFASGGFVAASHGFTQGPVPFG